MSEGERRVFFCSTSKTPLAPLSSSFLSLLTWRRLLEDRHGPVGRSPPHREPPPRVALAQPASARDKLGAGHPRGERRLDPCVGGRGGAADAGARGEAQARVGRVLLGAEAVVGREGRARFGLFVAELTRTCWLRFE